MNYDVENRTKIEESILCYIMQKTDFRDVQQRIITHGLDNPDYFQNKFCRDVYLTIKKAWDNDFVPDLLTLINLRPSEYRDEYNPMDKKGFDFNLIAINSLYISDVLFEQYCLVLKQYVIQDFWNNKANEILFNNWDNRDSLTVSHNIIESYNKLMDTFTSGIKTINNTSVIDEAEMMYQKAQSGENIFVPSGFAPFDVFTGGGFQGPEFTILAARPSMGKTTFAMILAMNAAFLYKKKVIFISLEMSKKQLMDKIIAKHMNLDYKVIKSYLLTREQFEKVKNWYRFFEQESSLKIYDVADVQNLDQIINQVKSDKPDMVIVDYIQLTKLNKVKGSREQEIAEISRSYKLLANELNIPIIGLSQLSRNLESRTNKRPMLSDLRESGALEQDADNVIFLYRDAYYRQQLNEMVPDYQIGNIEINLSKGRNSGTRMFEANMDMKNYILTKGFKFNN